MTICVSECLINGSRDAHIVYGRHTQWYFIVLLYVKVPQCSGNFSAVYFYNYSVIVFVLPLSGSSIWNVFMSSHSLFALCLSVLSLVMIHRFAMVISWAIESCLVLCRVDHSRSWPRRTLVSPCILCRKSEFVKHTHSTIKKASVQISQSMTINTNNI